MAEEAASRALDSVEIFDPATETWTTRAPLPHPMLGVGLVPLACGGALAIGGLTDRAGHAEAWTYDASKDRWTSAVRLLRPRGRSAVVVMTDGSVLVAGGGGTYESGGSAERIFAE